MWDCSWACQYTWWRSIWIIWRGNGWWQMTMLNETCCAQWELTRLCCMQLLCGKWRLPVGLVWPKTTYCQRQAQLGGSSCGGTFARSTQGRRWGMLSHVTDGVCYRVRSQDSALAWTIGDHEGATRQVSWPAFCDEDGEVVQMSAYRKIESAQGRKPSLAVREHYTEVVQLKSSWLSFSKPLWRFGTSNHGSRSIARLSKPKGTMQTCVRGDDEGERWISAATSSLFDNHKGPKLFLRPSQDLSAKMRRVRDHCCIWIHHRLGCKRMKDATSLSSHQNLQSIWNCDFSIIWIGGSCNTPNSCATSGTYRGLR
jgi:hypothetical protein